MATLTVRKLSDEVHLRLKFVANQRGVSAEEAARQLLDEATRYLSNKLSADFMRRL